MSGASIALGVGLNEGTFWSRSFSSGQRQTDRLIMHNESDVERRHAFRQSKTGELQRTS
jgi:hypothetical protein